ncbi:MAG: LysR family transcriptional regulator [Caldilineaceae bacterium]|nr:LysR family transcriptional regulator [Caldilineaceae bacterium]
MLDLHKLEIFLRVVREGSFSRAAESLLMTQPAVSQHIQDLEAQLGTQLFVRERRGVSPTQEGETLYGYATQILALMAEAESAVTDVRKLASGQLVLGATPGISIYLLPDYIQAFRAQYPQLSVTLHTGTTPQIVGELRAGQIELGLIEGELDAVTSAQLGIVALEKVEQLVVVGPKHPWWTRQSITLAELDRQPFIMRQPSSQTRIWLEDALATNDIHPKISAEFDNVESIKRTVMLGMCLSILPTYVVNHEVSAGQMHTIAIDTSPLQRTLKLIWDKEHHFSPVALAFLRHLSGRFPALAAIK